MEVSQHDPCAIPKGDPYTVHKVPIWRMPCVEVRFEMQIETARSPVCYGNRLRVFGMGSGFRVLGSRV